MSKFEIYSGSEIERFVLGTEGENTLVVIGINPSTADKEKSDRTIDKVVGHAKRYGYDSFKMINIYPVRATNIENLPMEFNEDLHNKNLNEIKNAIKGCSAVLCAWGIHINKRKYLKRCYNDILKLITDAKLPTYCLGVTKYGHPLHPLLRYIKTPEKLSDFDIKSYIA